MKAKLLVGLSILASAVLYRDTFSAYFFHDDCFSLRISNAHTLPEVVGFFLPRTDVIYYRPLGMQLPFFVLQRLFGLQPIAFHLTTWLFHAINCVLVYLLLRRLRITEHWAACGAFLYGVSTVHYLPLYWTATFAFTAGPTAVFASFLLFLSFLTTGQYRFYLWSIVVFILALGTYEMAVVLPVIMGLYVLYKQEMRRLLLLGPYVACAAGLFVIRFILYPPPLSGAYAQGIGISTLQNLKGYLLWSWQWPEEITAQFVSFFRLNAQFTHEFSSFLLIQTVTTVLLLFIVVGALIPAIRTKRLPSLVWAGVFCAGWFISGLFPILFFVGHSFSYYLPVSLVGLIYGVVFVLEQSAASQTGRGWSGVLIGTVISLWFIAAVNTVHFNAAIHWAPRRAHLSEELVQKAQRLYPPAAITKDRVVYVRPSSENKLSLNDQDGLIMIYGEPHLKTIYGYSVDHEVL